ncbi:uncharacterized protein LOC122815488 [Protopterus annectens]|uniref:uncharacterized protein LOC122815488 n=1 Tax=Protopterus annectens TaxID=7888 RepID=UPI001CF9FCCB|nr:uncharacterized protein LOC122815488 [Protopterus annectens]
MNEYLQMLTGVLVMEPQTGDRSNLSQQLLSTKVLPPPLKLRDTNGQMESVATTRDHREFSCSVPPEKFALLSPISSILEGECRTPPAASSASSVALPCGLLARSLLGIQASKKNEQELASPGSLRRKREFTPENQKDTGYWAKRKRNNEAARRSRQRRRMEEMLLESRALELVRENERLRAALLAIRYRFGMIRDPEEMTTQIPSSHLGMATTVSLLNFLSADCSKVSSPTTPVPSTNAPPTTSYQNGSNNFGKPLAILPRSAVEQYYSTLQPSPATDPKTSDNQEEKSNKKRVWCCSSSLGATQESSPAVLSSVCNDFLSLHNSKDNTLSCSNSMHHKDTDASEWSGETSWYGTQKNLKDDTFRLSTTCVNETAENTSLVEDYSLIKMANSRPKELIRVSHFDNREPECIPQGGGEGLKVQETLAGALDDERTRRTKNLLPLLPHKLRLKAAVSVANEISCRTEPLPSQDFFNSGPEKPIQPVRKQNYTMPECTNELGKAKVSRKCGATNSAQRQQLTNEICTQEFDCCKKGSFAPSLNRCNWNLSRKCTDATHLQPEGHFSHSGSGTFPGPISSTAPLTKGHASLYVPTSPARLGVPFTPTVSFSSISSFIPSEPVSARATKTVFSTAPFSSSRPLVPNPHTPFPSLTTDAAGQASTALISHSASFTPVTRVDHNYTEIALKDRSTEVVKDHRLKTQLDSLTDEVHYLKRLLLTQSTACPE